MGRRIVLLGAVVAGILIFSWEFFRREEVAKTTAIVSTDASPASPDRSGESMRGDGNRGAVLDPPEPAHQIAVHGTVLSANGPVAGAFVAARQGEYSAASFTNATGDFDVFLPRSGPMSFFIEGVRIVSGSPLELTEDVREHRLLVDGTGSISGIVLFDGVPVENASVVLDQATSVRTETEGHYAFAALSPGTKILRAKSDELHASSGAVEVVLPARGTLSGQMLSLERSAWIAGRVLNQDGAPVPDVLVTWRCDECSDGGQATTTSDGKFLITDLRGDGNFGATVQTMRGSVYPPAREAFPTVRVRSKDQISDVVLRINDALRTIEGRVTDAQGRAVPAVPVIALNEGRAYGRKPVAETQARGDGEFVLGGLTSGLYVVAAGDHGETGNVEHVEAGMRNVVVRLPPIGGVKGALEGFTDGIVNVSILGGPFQPMYAQLSTSARRFDFDEVPEGDWWLLASQGVSLAVGHVRVRTGERSDIVLRPASAQILGHIDGIGSSEHVNCDWFAKLPDLGLWFMGTAYPDASGKLSFQCLAGFPLKIECHSDDHVAEAELPAVQAGESMQVRLALSGVNSSAKASTVTR